MRLLAPSAAGLLLLSLPALAGESDTCQACSYAACLKGTIDRERALSAAYQGLEKKWDRFWTDTSDPKNPTRLDQVDLTTLKDGAARADALASLKKQFDEFRQDEEKALGVVPAAVGCGYDPATEVDLETDSQTCVIDTRKLDKLAPPCRELKEIAIRHEVFHKEKCDARRGKVPPEVPAPIQLTPAGKIREEIAAYRQDLSALEPLWIQARAQCCTGLVGTLEYRSTISNVMVEQSFLVDSDQSGLSAPAEVTHQAHFDLRKVYGCGDVHEVHWFASGKNQGNVSIELGRDGEYRLSIRADGVPGTTYSRDENNEPENCRKLPTTEHEGVFTSPGAILLGAKGRVDPKHPNVFSGTFTDTLGNVATWNLVRCTKKKNP